MNKTGLIFDIQRTSLHDGPGIRTTVFFKGCPLRCLWCHNPESRSFQPQVSFNREKCAHCLACVESCAHGAHQVEDGCHIFRHDLCTACGACLPGCSHDALKMIGERQTVEQIMAVVERDRVFYEHSGGGLTLSGGEPMSQFEFAVEILQACRESGIHTCLETSGFAPQSKYQQILPLADLFLVDYKASGAETHRQLVGVTSDLIRANLDFLYRQGAAIILRCPLIPGINDSDDHLEEIAKISQKYPDLVGIEIMAYHDLGRDKSLQIGQAYLLEGVASADGAVQQGWLEALARRGCKRAVIG